MKNSIFKSFRFEIIIYSILSFIYALLTEATIFLMGYIVRVFVGKVNKAEVGSSLQMSEASVDGIKSNINVNRYSQFSDGVGQREHIGLFVLMAIIIGITLFVIYFLILTKRFSVYLEEIVTGIVEMSSGNFNTRIRVKNDDEFALIAKSLNKMSEDIVVIIESERKNEQVKNELITSVAHDLRTPLTSIIGYLDLASKEEISPETRQKYFVIAYNKSLRLEKLIEDLFNYTKFSSGEVKLVTSELNMVKFVEQLVDEFYPSLQEASLVCEIATNCSDAIIIGDGDLLSRAFANLISNGVKYGRDGKVIRIKLVKDTEKVTVTIINYGEVIPKKDLSNVFDRFYRVENSRSRDTGGSGLGLAIAKRIVLMHEGTIGVTSDFSGTAFEVVLRLKSEEKGDEAGEVEI